MSVLITTTGGWNAVFTGLALHGLPPELSAVGLTLHGRPQNLADQQLKDITAHSQAH
jgi:hypothetical protein